jgi:hypothetical protein
VAPTEDNALKLAVEAYIYGYPLVLMDVSRQVMTAVSKPGGSKAPANQFGHLRAFPDYTFTDVVSPNADTLYSTSWLDLSAEPIVLSVPPVGDRYYLMPILDAWTNVFASPGTRTTGDGRGSFAITGPQWTGNLPPGLRQIKAPTAMAWMIGRTQTNGSVDYAEVRALQDGYQLIPLSSWGKPYALPAPAPVDPNADTKTSPVEQVARMDTVTYFNRLNMLMKDNPPAAGDADALALFAAIGIAPGKAFDAAMAKGLEHATRAGQEALLKEAKKGHGPSVNGWDVMPAVTGKFGTEYGVRAAVALIGLGANLPEDAVYPRATADGSGAPLTGANRYTIRFPKGQFPPVHAFWSLTMYNAKQAFIQNPINRYAIGDRDQLHVEVDGSLTIYLQHDSPGRDKECNWLPAPTGSFNVIMRLYWPSKEILNGTWKMPAIVKAK